MNTQLPFSADNLLSLEQLKFQAKTCTWCALSAGRTHSVFSDGSAGARVMLIGEGPGQQEDESGLPFVGRSGQLLTKILESVGIERQRDIYICNTVKCRPPGNRAPEPIEMETCKPYLEGQIHWIQPKLILLTGASAVRDVLQTKTPISKLRGQWLPTRFGDAQAMPIFHPSYLLRNPSREKGGPKWLMWQDMQELHRKMQELGIPLHGTPTAALSQAPQESKPLKSSAKPQPQPIQTFAPQEMTLF